MPKIKETLGMEPGACMLPKSGNACQKFDCETCGWYADEIRRRRHIPLVRDEDGLRRKHVGISDKP